MAKNRNNKARTKNITSILTLNSNQHKVDFASEYEVKLCDYSIRSLHMIYTFFSAMNYATKHMNTGDVFKNINDYQLKLHFFKFLDLMRNHVHNFQQFNNDLVESVTSHAHDLDALVRLMLDFNGVCPYASDDEDNDENEQ